MLPLFCGGQFVKEFQAVEAATLIQAHIRGYITRRLLQMNNQIDRIKEADVYNVECDVTLADVIARNTSKKYASAPLQVYKLNHL